MVVTAASRWFSSYCSRVFFAVANLTETRNGNDQNRMVFRQRPVWALSSVVINGTPILVVTDQISSGALFDTDMVYLRGYQSGVALAGWVYGSLKFQRGIQNCSFTYSAGFQTPGQTALGVTVAGAPLLPFDLTEGAAETAGYWLKRHRNIANESTGQGPERVSFSKEDVPPMVKTMLNTYRSATYRFA